MPHPNALRRAQTSEQVEPGAPVRVPLLVIIFTQASNTARRRWQQDTWLKQRWTLGELRAASAAAAQDEAERVSWRYVYMQARDGTTATQALDVVHVDTVTLSAVRESYANLVFKTLEALRWCLCHVAFGSMLKTDDDSIVHVGRAAAWLHHRVPSRARPLLYAGRLFNDSQIIRHNMSKHHLFHPEWFPDDFVKWAVPFASYSGGPYYPPYCSGGGYLLGPESARRIVAAYDGRVRRAQPVVQVEDAFVGILADASGVHATDITDYVQDPPVGKEQTPALFGGKLLVHRVADPKNAFAWLTFPVRVRYYEPADEHGPRLLRTSRGGRAKERSRALSMSQARSSHVSDAKT